MKSRPRILLLIPHLGGGGAERVAALVAAGLAPQKYEVHLGIVTGLKTLYGGDGESLPESVTVHRLGARRVRSAAGALLELIDRLQPDLILSGMAHLNFLILILRPFLPGKIKIMVRQNSTVSTALASGELPRFTRLLYRLLYPHADRILCQTSAMAADLARVVRLNHEQSAAKLVVVPNPIAVQEIRSRLKGAAELWSGAGPHLLAIGRLVAVKGFDLLLQSIAAVRRELPDAELTIVGAGPEAAALRGQCRELGLDQAVRFAGAVENPEQYFPGATAFVLSSRHEGLPNALLEAAAAGLPLVALPASQGIVDLLREKPGVWLAGEISAAALTESLLTALKSIGPRQRWTHEFIDEFRIERSIASYEQAIDALLGGAAGERRAR